MALKAIHTLVAVVGIATASAAAWWYQNRPAPQPNAQLADAPKGKGAAGPANGAGRGGGAGGANRLPSVEVARVETARLTEDAQAVGSLRSRQSVMLRPEVSGRVTQITFGDAQRVRKGQLLVQLDDQLPLAQLQQVEAELSIARANHKRNRELVEQGFISQRSLDESAAALQVAEAKRSLAQANVARLKILAPFDGIAGIRNVNVGDYLKDGADIVNIEDLEVMYVDFRLPERLQTKVQPGQTALVEVDALPGRRYAATVVAIDPLLDANGRSVAVRGCIDNRHLQLRPGMFARVTSVFSARDDARVIPEEAIVPQGGRQYVYRLVDGPDQDTRIAQRVEVQVGTRQPGRVEIIQGLQPGDVVVTAGQQRIARDATPVRVLDLRGALAPAARGASAAATADGRQARGSEAPAVVASLPGDPCVSAAAAARRGRPAR